MNDVVDVHSPLRREHSLLVRRVFNGTPGPMTRRHFLRASDALAHLDRLQTCAVEGERFLVSVAWRQVSAWTLIGRIDLEKFAADERGPQ
jgi:hypothetical protein